MVCGQGEAAAVSCEVDAMSVLDMEEAESARSREASSVETADVEDFSDSARSREALGVGVASTS